VPCHYGVSGLERKRKCESTGTFLSSVLKIFYLVA
jgi:hypothetical protein